MPVKIANRIPVTIKAAGGSKMAVLFFPSIPLMIPMQHMTSIKPILVVNALVME